MLWLSFLIVPHNFHSFHPRLQTIHKKQRTVESVQMRSLICFSFWILQVCTTKLPETLARIEI